MKEKLKAISSACIKCDLCQKECAFLRKYGKPKDIADRYDPARKEDQGMPFECSLCGLCTAVCPKGLDPAGLFLAMRQETVIRGGGDYSEHAVLKGYERRGTSRAYSYYGLPEGCDTVFFPGCTLSGTRSEKVILAYRHLREKIPSLGIVLDCCTKPSHDLGRTDHFTAMFEEMRGYLVVHGVKSVIVACPNCYKIFARYGTGLSTTSIYEILAESAGNGTGKITSTVTVHDPCAVRFKEAIHTSVRKLIRGEGCAIEEMPHTGKQTLCCGEGGAVGFLTPDFAGSWGRLRQEEATGRKIVTYCAGCAGKLAKLGPTAHVLDLLWEGKEGATGSAKVAKPPFTYWKRLRLKKWFEKHVPAAVARERTFTGKEEQKKGGMVKFLLFLVFLAVVIATVKTTGAARYLEQQTLKTLIESTGVLAPIVYMLVYTIAPALFLPGLPITIAGGILFGPFWGVVYTIIASTTGACVAFLVSRYLAREWVEGQLKSPRWRRLDEGVEQHGWKVVAFTRLIPLFPFNLLNYAFGLTKIGFRQYAVTTFVCMLPACIAFIVFSSSLLDLIRGKVSSAFVAGLLLVVLVSLFPLIYRRYKAKRRGDDPEILS
ncbi:MAG: TVP38/TMEM64 family inner membrane protein YdjZ [Syntrophorhabdus sp. PtaU1.Bin050]|nr:MAG: TVP38/TMEM64 family inner membrane protein YdjZ [Syntrophorhabdus sp. PtaU1.Bin050]